MAMRKHNSSKLNDPTVLHSSSIALLQERFRQLQRIKEVRKERELLRVFADADMERPHSSPSNHCKQQPKWLSHPDLLIQQSRPSHCLHSHSHTQRSGSSYRDFHDSETSLSIGFWPDQTNINGRTPKVSDEMDIDTSLHL